MYARLQKLDLRGGLLGGIGDVSKNSPSKLDPLPRESIGSSFKSLSHSLVPAQRRKLGVGTDVVKLATGDSSCVYSMTTSRLLVSIHLAVW